MLLDENKSAITRGGTKNGKTKTKRKKGEKMKNRANRVQHPSAESMDLSNECA